MTISNLEGNTQHNEDKGQIMKNKKFNNYKRNKRYNNNNNNNNQYRAFSQPNYGYYYYNTPYYYPPMYPITPTPAMNTTTRDDEDLEIIMHDENSVNITTKLDLKKQLEYYFSRQNLLNDTFLVSQMDADMYVPIALIASFKRVREFTTDIQVIINTLKESSTVMLDETGTKVKPNISLERNTVILRDVPDCTQEELELFLNQLDSPAIKSLKKDIGNMWYITLARENDALTLLSNIRGKSFKNKLMAARMKSEPITRLPHRPQQNQYPATTTTITTTTTTPTTTTTTTTTSTIPRPNTRPQQQKTHKNRFNKEQSSLENNFNKLSLNNKNKRNNQARHQNNKRKPKQEPQFPPLLNQPIVTKEQQNDKSSSSYADILKK